MSSRYSFYDNNSSKSEKCRACTDFKSWTKQQSESQRQIKRGDTSPNIQKEEGRGCPLDRGELGRASWSLLHSVAAHFPEAPTPRQQDDMRHFLRLFSEFYPCNECARDLREDMSKHPPATASRRDLSQWMCEAHNNVNARLGKPLFDCSSVDQRWRTGWRDGSCD